MPLATIEFRERNRSKEVSPEDFKVPTKLALKSLTKTPTIRGRMAEEVLQKMEEANRNSTVTFIDEAIMSRSSSPKRNRNLRSPGQQPDVILRKNQ